MITAAALTFGASFALADANDAWLTTKAKIALLSTDDVSATAVNVDTKDGHVTIHGKVETEAEKGRAEAAVRKIDGVKDVKNLLQVVREAEKKRVDATDERIEDSVEAAFKADPSVDGIKVSSVNKGVVLLSGNAKDLNAKLKALELAWATPGVRKVSSEMQTKER
jgi:osmotically-inducible protein OsmY